MNGDGWDWMRLVHKWGLMKAINSWLMVVKDGLLMMVQFRTVNACRVMMGARWRASWNCSWLTCVGLRWLVADCCHPRVSVALQHVALRIRSYGSCWFQGDPLYTRVSSLYRHSFMVGVGSEGFNCCSYILSSLLIPSVFINNQFSCCSYLIIFMLIPTTNIHNQWTINHHESISAEPINPSMILVRCATWPLRRCKMLESF